MPAALAPFHAIVITPEAEALSSLETVLIVYAFNMGADIFIRAVRTICNNAATWKAPEEGISSRGITDTPCVKAMVVTCPILSLSFGARRLATPMAAFEKAKRIPISALLAENLELR